MAPGKRTTATVQETRSGPYIQRGTARDHVLTIDEPTELGGNDAGPDPYELLLMALGACTNMTLRMYAKLKNLPLEGITVQLSHQRIHATDCAECEDQQGMLDRIERDITLVGEKLTDAEKKRLLEIANRCPVHRSLSSENSIVSRLV